MLASLRIVPFKMQDLMGRISQKRDELLQDASERFTPLGYAPEAVAPLRSRLDSCSFFVTQRASSGVLEYCKSHPQP